MVWLVWLLLREFGRIDAAIMPWGTLSLNASSRSWWLGEDFRFCLEDSAFGGPAGHVGSCKDVFKFEVLSTTSVEPRRDCKA